MERRINSIIIPYFTLLKQVTNQTRSAVTLSYKVLGDEGVGEPDIPPIFILHGFLGMKKHWESLGKTILNMTKRSVVVVDQRNHGDSPKANSHKYEDLAKDVLNLLDKLAVDKACLLGHCMGGKTSMCVSLLAPQRVSGLLLVDISPITTPLLFTEFMPEVLSAMKTVEFHPKNLGKAKKLAKRQLKEVIKDDVLLKEVLSNVRVNSNGTIGWACNLDVLRKQFKHLTSFPKEMKGKKYRGPVLFIGGQHSEYIPPDDLTKIRTYFPSAVIHYIPNTRHYVHVDNPRAFLEYCITFSRTLKEIK